MSTSPHSLITPLHAAQLLGITSSLFLSGTYFASPALFIPLLLLQPTKLSISLFADLFHRGALFIVPLSVISTLSSAVAAFLCPAHTNVDVLRRRISVAAALFAFAPLAYTRLVMAEGIDRLVQMAGEKGKAETEEEEGGRDGEVRVLLKRWAGQTYVRAALAGTGGLVGLWGVVL